MTRFKWCLIPVLGLALLNPIPAAAQAVGTATIAGTVTDPSGAVVPGATVEAASPALIEGSRVAVTNGEGQYSIVNLRPGTYTITFSLSGFSGVRREGLQLTTDFTAQVNAQLGVGGVEETVTVEATAPVVDVQGVAQPRVYTREAIDALPTGRSPDSMMATIPGVTPGFFGQQFRGIQDSLTMVDGMRATNMIGAGPSLTTASTNSNMYQEMSFSTSIDSAEIGQAGMRINLVPRDGGNTFKGSVYTSYTRGPWQASNIDDELEDLGFGEPATTFKDIDFNPTFGGPILRDTLWFQTSYRYTDNDTQVFGSFFDADPRPFAYEADLSRPASSQTTSKSFVQRLSWQVTPKDKIAGSYDWFINRSPLFRNFLLGPNPPPSATLDLKTPRSNLGGRWTRTHTSRLLFEASLIRSTSDTENSYSGEFEPWSAKHVESGLPTTPPTEFAIINLNNRRLLNLANVTDITLSRTMEARGSVTYVTGSHSLKAGVSMFRGTHSRPTSVIGNQIQRYRNGIPVEIDLVLPGTRHEQIDGDWAFYVQDRWTKDRLTVNAGLRMDWLDSSVPDQTLPASPWLGSVSFEGQDVLNLKDLSPRLGAAYDLFGNGKTAVKVAFSRFVAGETVALTGAANPIRAVSDEDRRTWNDLNGDHSIFNADGSVQNAELGPSNNPAFGTAVSTVDFNPNVLEGWFNREYYWETNISVQHELMPRIGLTALYYRRTQGNQRTNDNVNRSPADYDGPFCVTAPTDARLGSASGSQICGLFDLKPTSVRPTKNLTTFASELGTGAGFDEVVQGYEFNINARLPRGAFLSGGFNFQKELTNAQRGGGFFGGPVFNTCDVIDNPEVRFCEVESSFAPDFKLNGSVVLPYDIQVAGTYRGLAGPTILGTWNATNADIIPGLGRPLTNAFSKAIALVEPDQERGAMRHIFDLRFGKIINISRYSVNVMADLYNAFNTNAVSSINTTVGSDYLLPTGVQAPRQFRLSAQFDF